uniref:Thioredoxin-like protein 4A n=1 Tax=Corvus moneduloides TaxID=1196302 RepID=A0A8C3EN95_CORMO
MAPHPTCEGGGGSPWPAAPQALPLGRTRGSRAAGSPPVGQRGCAGSAYVPARAHSLPSLPLPARPGAAAAPCLGGKDARGARQPAARMSYMLPHLHNGWQVDQAILSEEDRVVVIRFGHDWDPTCMKMDEVLYSIAEKVKNFAVIYLVDITEVPDFNKMYELYDPCTVMFFFRNKHIMIDLGTGNNNKINWAMEDKQEMIDIIETVYRGARKGRGLVVSPKDYSTKYRY